MLEFSNHRVSLFQQMVAPEQGGLLSGKHPAVFSSADPLKLWIVQAGIIICTTSVLSLWLSRMHQPKVIAEVLGGILLGPSAFGRIPGFTEVIFPVESRSYLSLVANIGLCLFLFLVGLEIDAEVIKRNARLSTTVALAGMALPFGIGVGMAHAVYKEFVNPNIVFTHFMLFTGVAYSITAFPVLCRILTELKLLDTTVGIVVLSAGVGNDIVGWILLALSVALVNASNGLTALYILFACFGWILFLMFPVKTALGWLAQKTGSIESGPTVSFMTVTMLITFGSALFTDVIGVHAIFGAFIAGLIVPREGGLAIMITEKLEDMVSIIFLPLYFTLSGLSTDLGLLNDTITWGYTIGIIITAFVGKFGGCAIAAHYLAGFNWRESSTIGSLMSCKGLVELIVLNVGLSAGILSRRVFSMFVLEALVLTFMTTPLVTYFYPPHLRYRTAWANFDIAVEECSGQKAHSPLQDGEFKTRFTVVLDKLEHVPGMMALTQLIQPPLPSISSRQGNGSSEHEPRASSSQSVNHVLGVSLEALRLIELSDRVSDVMKSTSTDSLYLADPLLSIFRMFGQLNGIHVSPSLSAVKSEDFAHTVAEHARRHESDMIMLLWLHPVRDSFEGPPPLTPIQGPIALPLTDTPGVAAPKSPHSNNPLDILFRFGSGGTSGGGSSSVVHSKFVHEVFSQATTDVALFVDQNTLDSPSIVGGVPEQHIFLPFFGGPDDRLALEFVVQICANLRMRGTVVRITKCDNGDTAVLSTHDNFHESRNMEENISSVGSRTADGVNGQLVTHTHMQSETADNLIWARYAKFPTASNFGRRTPQSTSFFPPSNIEFKSLSTIRPLHAAIQAATDCEYPKTTMRLTVVTGRSRRLDHRWELKEFMNEHASVGPEVRKTIGDVGTAFVVAGVGSGVVVLQAAGIGTLD